ncbi:hypothetical protein [Paenibacillus sp. GCM10027626]|uniref:hypothetical protein n=1 Tax=Paenibacillus sp. GCM10027626 TaxID=3273411 RepID=UPI003642C649
MRGQRFIAAEAGNCESCGHTMRYFVETQLIVRFRGHTIRYLPLLAGFRGDLR